MLDPSRLSSRWEDECGEALRLHRSAAGKPADFAMIPDTGLEWIVDARGCPAATLSNLDVVRACCERIVREMGLHVVGQPQWRKFDGPGGVTGLYLLSESHLSVHTFPEFGLVCLNVYCCRPRIAPEWETLLRDELGASAVVVRELTRGLSDGVADPTISVSGHHSGGEPS